MPTPQMVLIPSLSKDKGHAGVRTDYGGNATAKASGSRRRPFTSKLTVR